MSDERLPRHGEPGAYPDFIDPDSLIEVIQAGPRGGYGKDDGKDEGESPTGDNSVLEEAKTYKDLWLERHPWPRRALWLTRLLVEGFIRGSVILASGVLALLESIYARPPRRRKGHGKKHRNGWRSAQDYQGCFPRKESRSNRNPDYQSEEL